MDGRTEGLEKWLACHASLNDTKISPLTVRVNIPLVKSAHNIGFTKENHWILTLTVRELILVSFKPAWTADFGTAIAFFVHEMYDFS